MASSTETTLQLEAVSPAPSPQIPTSGETLNLDVMSPAAMAYLLEVLSVDMNKIEELNRLRRSSGGKVGIVLGGKTIDETPLIGSKIIDETSLIGGKTIDEPSLLGGKTIGETSLSARKGTPVDETPSEVTQKSETNVASKLTTTQTTVSTLPSIATILTTSSTPTLADVTNQQELNNEASDFPSKRKSHRKRTLDEDDDQGSEETADNGKSKKRSRSITTSSEENLSPSPQKHRSSSISSNGSPESTPDTTSTTAVVQPTLKTSDNNNTPEDNAKKSRSRRFKEDELAFLDAVFKTDPYPDPMITERLSIQLDVPEHRIKVWFANRRHRQTRTSDPKPTTIPSLEKTDLLTEMAALPAESSHASSAFPCKTSMMPPYGTVPSGYNLSHPTSKISTLRTIPPRTPDLNAQLRTEAQIRSQIASTIQSRFPFLHLL